MRIGLSTIDPEWPVGVVFGRVAYRPGGSLGPRVQPDVQIVVLDHGSLSLTTDGVTREVGVGEMVCQWPGSDESYQFDETSVSIHRWVSLTFQDSPGLVAWLAHLRRGSPGVLRETPLMRALFDAGRELDASEFSEARFARAQYALAYLSTFLLGGPESGDLVSNQDSESPLPAPLVAMRYAIATRYAEPLQLASLAEVAHVSPSHLVRTCRKHLGTTPMRLLWDVRVERGVALLRHTGLAVSEVATRVGFVSPYHFSREVKARHGVPPREYRRIAWRLD